MIKSSGEATWSCYTGGCPVVLLQQDGGKQVDEGGGADATPSLYVVVVCWWPVTNPNTEKAGKRKVLGHEHMCCRLWGANKSLYMCIVCLWCRVKFKGKHKITVLQDMHFVQYFISFERDMLSQLRHAYNFPLSVEVGRGSKLFYEWSFQHELPLDLVFQFSGLWQSLPSDGINKVLRCRPVSEMSMPNSSPVTILIWDNN